MLPFGENWGKGPWDLCIIFTTSCESTVISKFQNFITIINPPNLTISPLFSNFTIVLR